MKLTQTKCARWVVLSALAGLIAFSIPLLAQDEAKPAKPAADDEGAAVIGKLGDVELTAAEFDRVLSTVAPEVRAQVSRDSNAKQTVATEMLRMKLLAREALKRKLDEDPKVRGRLESARQEVLAQSLLATLGDGGEDGDRKYFEKNAADFDTLTVRHILVGSGGPAATRSDAEAKKKADDLHAQLTKGADFAKLVQSDTDDPESKKDGGQYTFGRGRMVPQFEKASYSLKENEISKPVKTQYGYHIIQLQKRVPTTFEAARDSIPRQRFEKLMDELSGGAEPKLDGKFFAAPEGPASPPAKGAAKGAQPRGR